MHSFGLLYGLLGNGAQHVDESVDGFLALALGRLNHH